MSGYNTTLTNLGGPSSSFSHHNNNPYGDDHGNGNGGYPALTSTRSSTPYHLTSTHAAHNSSLIQTNYGSRISEVINEQNEILQQKKVNVEQLGDALGDLEDFTQNAHRKLTHHTKFKDELTTKSYNLHPLHQTHQELLKQIEGKCQTLNQLLMEIEQNDPKVCEVLLAERTSLQTLTRLSDELESLCNANLDQMVKFYDHHCCQLYVNLHVMKKSILPRMINAHRDLYEVQLPSLLHQGGGQDEHLNAVEGEFCALLQQIANSKAELSQSNSDLETKQQQLKALQQSNEAFNTIHNTATPFAQQFLPISKSFLTTSDDLARIQEQTNNTTALIEQLTYESLPALQQQFDTIQSERDQLTTQIRQCNNKIEHLLSNRDLAILHHDYALPIINRESDFVSLAHHLDQHSAQLQEHNTTLETTIIQTNVEVSLLNQEYQFMVGLAQQLFDQLVKAELEVIESVGNSPAAHSTALLSFVQQLKPLMEEHEGFKNDVIEKLEVYLNVLTAHNQRIEAETARLTQLAAERHTDAQHKYQAQLQAEVQHRARQREELDLLKTQIKLEEERIVKEEAQVVQAKLIAEAYAIQTEKLRHEAQTNLCQVKASLNALVTEIKSRRDGIVDAEPPVLVDIPSADDEKEDDSLEVHLVHNNKNKKNINNKKQKSKSPKADILEDLPLPQVTAAENDFNNNDESAPSNTRVTRSKRSALRKASMGDDDSDNDDVISTTAATTNKRKGNAGISFNDTPHFQSPPQNGDSESGDDFELLQNTLHNRNMSNFYLDQQSQDSYSPSTQESSAYNTPAALPQESDRIELVSSATLPGADWRVNNNNVEDDHEEEVPPVTMGDFDSNDFDIASKPDPNDSLDVKQDVFIPKKDTIVVEKLNKGNKQSKAKKNQQKLSDTDDQDDDSDELQRHKPVAPRQTKGKPRQGQDDSANTIVGKVRVEVIDDDEDFIKKNLQQAVNNDDDDELFQTPPRHANRRRKIPRSPQMRKGARMDDDNDDDNDDDYEDEIDQDDEINDTKTHAKSKATNTKSTKPSKNTTSSNKTKIVQRVERETAQVLSQMSSPPLNKAQQRRFNDIMGDENSSATTPDYSQHSQSVSIVLGGGLGSPRQNEIVSDNTAFKRLATSPISTVTTSLLTPKQAQERRREQITALTSPLRTPGRNGIAAANAITGLRHMNTVLMQAQASKQQSIATTGRNSIFGMSTQQRNLFGAVGSQQMQQRPGTQAQSGIGGGLLRPKSNNKLGSLLQPQQQHQQQQPSSAKPSKLQHRRHKKINDQSDSDDDNNASYHFNHQPLHSDDDNDRNNNRNINTKHNNAQAPPQAEGRVKKQEQQQQQQKQYEADKQHRKQQKLDHQQQQQQEEEQQLKEHQQSQQREAEQQRKEQQQRREQQQREDEQQKRATKEEKRRKLQEQQEQQEQERLAQQNKFTQQSKPQPPPTVRQQPPQTIRQQPPQTMRQALSQHLSTQQTRQQIMATSQQTRTGSLIRPTSGLLSKPNQQFINPQRTQLQSQNHHHRHQSDQSDENENVNLSQSQQQTPQVTSNSSTIIAPPRPRQASSHIKQPQPILNHKPTLFQQPPTGTSLRPGMGLLQSRQPTAQRSLIGGGGGGVQTFGMQRPGNNISGPNRLGLNRR